MTTRHESTGDDFRSLIDAARCTDRIDVGRCALYAQHDGPHAYAEIRSRKPWQSVTHRWSDDGERWVDGQAKPLRWCALHAD